MANKINEERRLEEVEQCSDAMQACNDGQYEVARDIWEKLANKGNLVASVDLARLHMRSLVNEPNFDFAAKLFEEAGEQGLPEAFVELGGMYEDGIGIESNNQSSSCKFQRC